MATSRRSCKNGDSNVFTWLDQVRERPSMWAQTLRDLESQVWGYSWALRNHRIVEPVPSMTRHFLYWVHYRTGWSTSAGWAIAIEAHVSDPKKRFAKFFRLVDEYRQLVPTALYTVRLTKPHQPTGKRVVIGFDGRMETPRRVDILRYAPEPFHFLRFHYPKWIEDWSLLTTSDMSIKTTVSHAKRWVRDELQVKDNEWQSPA